MAGFDLDTIVNLFKATICSPLGLALFVAYRARESQQFPPPRDGLLTTAYSFLALYGIRWFSNRWRNGLIPRPRLNSNTWKNEVVLVTGAASGIAKETVEILKMKGAKVAAIDIVDFKVDHPNVRTYKVDISDYQALEALKPRIKADLGGNVTMVANIAGLNNKSLILDLDEKKISKMIDVNLKSHFWTARIFLPDMIKAKRGHFLSVSSTMGYVGICHQSDYVATKHGVVGMQESLYYEMQKMYKTPAVCISVAMIGHTKTPLFETFDVGPVGRFLGPLLEPSHVAKEIVEAFESQESKIICTPVSVNLAAGLKALPSFLRDFFQFSSGADGSYPSRPTPEQLGN